MDQISDLKHDFCRSQWLTNECSANEQIFTVAFKVFWLIRKYWEIYEAAKSLMRIKNSELDAEKTGMQKRKKKKKISQT